MAFVDTILSDSRLHSLGTSDTPQNETPTVVGDSGQTLPQGSILLDGPILPQPLSMCWATVEGSRDACAHGIWLLSRSPYAATVSTQRLLGIGA